MTSVAWITLKVQSLELYIVANAFSHFFGTAWLMCVSYALECLLPWVHQSGRWKKWDNGSYNGRQRENGKDLSKNYGITRTNWCMNGWSKWRRLEGGKESEWTDWKSQWEVSLSTDWRLDWYRTGEWIGLTLIAFTLLVNYNFIFAQPTCI